MDETKTAPAGGRLHCPAPGSHGACGATDGPVALELDAGSLGVLRGTLDPVLGIVRCSDHGRIPSRMTAASCLRAACEDGRINLPDPVRAAVARGSLLLVAGVSHG